MKEIKVQQAILAMAHTPNRIRFGKLNDGRMGVTIDGAAVYIIYSDTLLLDTTKFQTIDLRKIFDDVYNAKDIIPTGISMNKLNEFKNDDTTAYFDEKLFKYFDSKKKISYKYHKTKLFVFENGELVGLVLETRVRK